MKYFNIRTTLVLALFLIFSSIGAQNDISGVIYYHENDTNPVGGVNVALYDINDILIATYITDDNGEFLFEGIPFGDYYILSDANLASGDITMASADLVLDYLNGTYQLEDYEFEAADVNGNGNVNHGDYQQIVNKVLGHGNAFPDGWKFEVVYINNATRGLVELPDIWGTSTGDVEGIWMPGGRDIDLFEELQLPVTINAEEIELEIGSNYNDFINGFNLNMIYPVDLIEITDIIGPDENFHYRLDETTGELSVFWLDESRARGITFKGETLFKVRVKQLQNSIENREGAFSLLDGGMILDGRSNKIDDIRITLPKITTQAVEPDLDLEIASYPNPVINSFNIKITSPVNNSASIFVYDLVGRLVKETTNIAIYKGAQIIKMNTEHLPAGHYVYKIRMKGMDSLTGRFYKTE